MNYQVGYDCTSNGENDMVLGVKVPAKSLCPCSKRISDYGAHSQRSLVTVKVSFAEFVWLEELIKWVENSASSEIYALLKRVDEKFVTEIAYNNPTFVEDVVREVTLKLQKDERITAFQVESENFESIHNHNAYACVKRNKEEK